MRETDHSTMTKSQHERHRVHPGGQLSTRNHVGLIVLLGASLNQSAVIGGLNLSISDAAMLLVLTSLLLTRALWIPQIPLAVFLIFSTVTTLNAAFFVSAVIGVDVPLAAVLSGYVKLCVSFAFFAVGVQIARSGHFWVLARSFYIGAIFVSTIGALRLVGFRVPFSDDMVYGGFRFLGLMNDPNYYAVITVVALALLYRDPLLSSGSKMLLSLILAAGVVSSASKTGLIALLFWATWSLVLYIVRVARTSSVRFVGLAVVGVLTGTIVVSLVGGSLGRELLASENPALARIAPLLMDFDSAVVEGGSGRETTWANAQELTQRLPVLGTGPGAYGLVAENLFGSGVLAHNTFLQLFAEWGLPFALAFWCIVFLLVGRASLYFRQAPVLAMRDASLVLLVGSIGISLNNARLFWILLGALYFSVFCVPQANHRLAG